MAFAGGSADKVGNEYETWWTLRRVTQLLRGEIEAMTVEPLGADGAELWVESQGVRTYDQVKFRSSGTWTPTRLRSDGVLAKLGPYYAVGSKVLLLLSQPSEELEQLIHMAETTASGAELWSSVTSTTGLDLLRDAWGVDRDETRTYLAHTSVRHDGMQHLREYVDLTFETLVLGETPSAIGAVRRFLDEQVNMTFAAPLVWAALEKAGFPPRPQLEPGPTISQLQGLLERHVRAVRRSTPSAGTIGRREVTEIVDAISSTRAPVLLVAGKAGAGKSIVVADAAEGLSRAGHHVAAVRLDRLPPTTSTAAQLGVAMDLRSSPVVTLSEVSPSGFDGILIIDQLDAVSNYSGRMPAVYEAVDDAINQARLLGNVRVILAVRSIDLQEDPRLRRLAGENVPTIEVGELDAGEVRDYLSRIDTDPTKVDASTLQLLRLPIHLYVFSALAPQMRREPYGTLTSLYAAFTRAFRLRLELAAYPDEWPEVSRVLVERMNSDEALAVPLGALDHIRPLYVEALISANVLVEEDGRVSLFHETFFDFLFAKSFVPRDGALVEWFLNSGQGLFRRSQLRQLLTYIATEDRRTFVSQVLAIADSALRPHLVSIAYTVLASFNPTPSDWMAIRRLISSDNPFLPRAIGLVGDPRWFAVIDTAGDAEKLLDDPLWIDFVPRMVGRLAADFPDRVLELLAPRRCLGSVWVEALRAAVEVSDSPAWVDFVLEQTASGGLDLPERPFDLLQSSLFHRMVEPYPPDALRLLVVSLSYQVEQAIAAGSKALDDDLSQRGRHSVDESELDQLAMASPLEFVESLAPLIEQIATYRPPDGRMAWRYRVRGRHHDFADDLFLAFDGALTRLTRDDPRHALPLIKKLAGHDVDPLNFLVCRALHEADADLAVDWLLQSEDHLAIGWLSDVRWESRRLIDRASRACSDDRFANLEAALLHFKTAKANPALYLQWNGMAELELLSALAIERLSGSAIQRLAELQRKFPFWEPAEPTGISGGTVQSPIPRSSADLMTDAHWLRAIEKYRDSDHTTFRAGGAFGGGRELASMIGALTKDDPERFVAFALQLPTSTPPAYTEHIVRTAAGAIDQRTLVPLLEKFRSEYPTESGRAVVSAIDAYSAQLSDELFEELLRLSEDADPAHELATTKSNSGYYFGGDFVTAGINSTRGSAASTLARVIYADSSRLVASLPVIERFARDPIIAVRALASEPALAYASSARDAGLDVIEILLDNEYVLTTSPALRALRWAMLWNAERFAPFLSRALEAEDGQEAGALWANCFVNDSLGSAPSELAALPESARLGVADAIASNPVLGRTLLALLFNDDDPGVRNRAARSMHYLQDVDPVARDELITLFAQSAAFSESMDDLLDALESLSGDLPSMTWDLCRRVVERIETAPPGGLGSVTGNLVSVLVRLYRSAATADRDATLDLIDRTVLLQLWRVDEALDETR
jgi:hypothetical protein